MSDIQRKTGQALPEGYAEHFRGERPAWAGEPPAEEVVD